MARIGEVSDEAHDLNEARNALGEAIDQALQAANWAGRATAGKKLLKAIDGYVDAKIAYRQRY